MILEELGVDEHPVDDDDDPEAIQVDPSAQAVPDRFRLTGDEGECEGTNGRAVELVSHSRPYEGQDWDRMASTHRFLAVEVEADCEAVFAATAALSDRFEWAGREVERDLELGQWGPPAEGAVELRVVRPPLGTRGRFADGTRFEDHATCDQTHTMELRAGARVHSFDWHGYGFGLLHVGARTFFADRELFRWTLRALDGGPAPELPGLPSSTAVDVDPVEMDGYACEEAAP